MVTPTEKLIEIRDEILEKLYREAKPPVESLEKLKQKEKETDQPVYNLHYLNDEVQINIIDEELRGRGLSKTEKRRLRSGILLGSAPNGHLESVNKYREEEGLKPVKED